MEITLDELRQIEPNSPTKFALWVDPLNAAMAEFDINTEQRIEMFIAQIMHESNGLATLVENLNYSAQGLANTWARYSTTGKRGGPPNDLAISLNRNPQGIANNTYANRNGNGDEASCDGWHYRGRGALQVTGRANYTDVSNALHIDCVLNPDLLLDPLQAVRSAAWFWKAHGLNEVADTGVFDATTRTINGADLGDKQRIGLWTLAKTVIG